MTDRMMVIQLSATDAYRLLWLAQKEALNGPIYNADWQRIANEVNECLLAQQAGKFFQCAACHEEMRDGIA